MSTKRDLKEYIKNLPRKEFQSLLSVASSREYAKAFNRGVDALSTEERNTLEETFAKQGIKAPISNLEFYQIITAITERAMVYN